MIRFSYTRKGNILEVLGHSEYDDIGHDIVCAGVSMLLISNANLLKELSNKNEYLLDIGKGKFVLKLIKKTNINEKILLNIYNYLKELCNKYPENIKEVTR